MSGEAVLCSPAATRIGIVFLYRLIVDHVDGYTPEERSEGKGGR